MSETSTPPVTPAGPSQRGAGDAPTGWVGWVWFAGGLLILVGIFNVIVGLAALFRGQVIVAGESGALLFSVTGWGWVHLIIGILLALVGAGLFTNNAIARVAGVVLAGLNAVAQVAFLPVYPAWALLIIALDVVVLWAILVHGGEVTRV
jgi:hypothetical protein